MNELDQDGNSLFLLAQTAMEKGEVEKAEGYLREIVDLMGRTHHMSHLSLRALADISIEQGRYKDAINTSIDLLDAQIITFGVSHAEPSRTLESILSLCKSTGHSNMCAEIECMVETARGFDKDNRSMRKTRSSRVKSVEEEGAVEKLKKKIVGKLVELIKNIELARDLPGGWILGGIVGTFIACYLILFFLNMGAFHEGGRELLKYGTEYTTADGARKLELTSATDLVVQTGSSSLKLTFRAFGYSWRDVGPLMCCSFLDKERWFTQQDNGFRDSDGVIFYRSDAPELAIVHQMNEVMRTANQYYKEKESYPKHIKNISEDSFRYLNPFNREMDFPSIRTVRLEGKKSPTTIKFFQGLKRGGKWPDELELRAGSIECCRILYGQSQDQEFVMHGCDRNGKLLTGADGQVFLLSGYKGQPSEGVSVSEYMGLRAPTYCVLKAPPNMVPLLFPFMKFRFVALYVTLTLFLSFAYLLLRRSNWRGQALVLVILSNVTTLIAVLGVCLP